MPLYGNELDRSVNPYEANLGRVVKLEKGEFVGRAALAAIQQTGPRAEAGRPGHARRGDRPPRLPGPRRRRRGRASVTSGSSRPRSASGSRWPTCRPHGRAVGGEVEVSCATARTAPSR